MRFRIVVALSVSVLLILGSLFYRHATLAKAPVNLIPTEQIASEATSSAYDYAASQAVATTTREDLSTTDLIGRQLISSYLDLAATGQATSDNLNALADQYAAQIPSLSVGEKIDVRDLQVVDDTQENLQAYADTLMATYKEFRGRVGSSGINNNDINLLNASFLPTAKAMSSVYSEAGHALASMPVPRSLVLAHINLTNNLFSNAAALNTLTLVDSDPAVALSGLINLSANLRNEAPLLTEIVAVLNKHGI